MELMIPAALRGDCAGLASLSSPGETLGEALERLRARYPALLRRLAPGGLLASDADFLLDARDMRLRGGLLACVAEGVSVEVRLREARLSPQDATRYARQLVLPEVGAAGQERLLAARVLVVGAGGLGAPALTYLAAAGVGHLGIVDGDRVERTNLHRQTLFCEADIGAGKAEAARRALLSLNPAIDVAAHPYFLTSDNALQLFAQYDLVVNGSDNFPTRYLVSDAATLSGLGWVDASILRFEGQVAVYLPGGGCYRCLFPSPPPPGSVPSCAEAGVFGALAGQVGAVQAMEAVKLVLGAGESLAGRLLVIDALTAGSRSFRVARDPSCPVCGDQPTQRGLIDYADFCGAPSPSQEARGAPEISARDAAGLLSSPAVQWLDVRLRTELPRAGIPGALALPLEELAAGPLPLDPGREVIAFCDIGLRSQVAADILAQRGFTARSLGGGLVAWRAAGLPLAERDG